MPAPAPETSSEPPVLTGPTPIRAVVRVDGKVNFQGATYELPEFKTKMEALAKATPDQSIVIRAGKTVPYEKIKAVFDVCRDANVKYISAATATPPTTSAAPASSEPTDANLPTPGLIMHPSMEPTPGSPSPAPSASDSPTTNAPTTTIP